MNRKGRMARYIGVVCWFLALLLLFTHAQEKKAQEAAEQQNAIIREMDAQTEEGSTILYPSVD